MKMPGLATPLHHLITLTPGPSANPWTALGGHPAPFKNDLSAGSHSCGHPHHQRDQILLNGNSLDPGALQIRDLRRTHALRQATDAQVNRMLVTQGPASATPEDAAKIREELSQMDPLVLRALANHGTTIRVVGKEESLLDAGLLRPISEKDFLQNLEADKSRIAAAQRDVQTKHDGAIAVAQAKLDQLASQEQPLNSTSPFFGGTPSSPEKMEAQAEVNRLRSLKNDEMTRRVREASDGRWLEYRPSALSEANGRDSGSALDSMAGLHVFNLMPAANGPHLRGDSLDQMAASHGLTDPAQASQFKAQVYTMNQERIDAARSQQLERWNLTSQGTGESAERTKQLLAEAQGNPDSVPIYLAPDERPLLVPNTFATTVRRQGQEQQATLTLHDVKTYHDWTDLNGRASRTNVLGQYFYENGRSEVLVRREELGLPTIEGRTLIHEMGHAVESVLERENPGFFESFEARLRDSHRTARPHQQPTEAPASQQAWDPNRRAVSTYAETNSHEFFAEGYAFYIRDPERLKSLDAKLYQLVDEAYRTLGAR